LTQPWLGVLVIATVALLIQLVSLPLSVWRTFRLETRFGFNRTTPGLFLADLGKSLALAVLLGGPLLIATLVLMERAGRWWWVWAWGLWLGVMFLMAWAWPAFIAPLFNRFSPLEDQALRRRIEALLTRCGFASKGYSSWTTRGARATATPTSPASAGISASCSSTRCSSVSPTRRSRRCWRTSSAISA